MTQQVTVEKLNMIHNKVMEVATSFPIQKFLDSKRERVADAVTSLEMAEGFDVKTATHLLKIIFKYIDHQKTLGVKS